MGTTPGAALRSVQQALDAIPSPSDRNSGADVALGNWRWTVRQRILGVRDMLVDESAYEGEGWLMARGGAAIRERNELLLRLSRMAPHVLEDSDVDNVREELRRLLVDISHHLQRLRDLAYDEVNLELGGSE
ncbi:hypothetical protein [Nocardioides pacificus]